MGEAAAAGVDRRTFGRRARVGRARFFGQAPRIPLFRSKFDCQVGRVIKTTSSSSKTTATIILQRVNTHVSKSDPLDLATALRESFRGLEGLPLKSVKAQGCLRGSGLLNLVSSLVSGTVQRVVAAG